MLFLGWLLAAFVVVGAINIYLKYCGQTSRSQTCLSSSKSESLHWINVFFQWLNVSFKSLDIFGSILKAINEQARKCNVSDFPTPVRFWQACNQTSGLSGFMPPSQRAAKNLRINILPLGNFCGLILQVWRGAKYTVYYLSPLEKFSGEGGARITKVRKT